MKDWFFRLVFIYGCINSAWVAFYQSNCYWLYIKSCQQCYQTHPLWWFFIRVLPFDSVSLDDWWSAHLLKMDPRLLVLCVWYILLCYDFWDMVLEKRLDYGFIGYQVPPMPRATRSARVNICCYTNVEIGRASCRERVSSPV